MGNILAELTKEEIKSIKQGSSYKSWNRKRRIIILVAMVWAFGGIALINIIKLRI